MMLELGPGTIPHPRVSVGLDLYHPIGTGRLDAATQPWPLVDGCVDEIYSSHFMEHVAKGDPLIHVMSEALRVLKPGGTFTVVHPLVGYTDDAGNGKLVAGWQPYADPTHVQFWWYPESLLYFCEGPFKPNADYGMPVWSELGPWIPEEHATQLLRHALRNPAPSESWWSVRGGWEGVARLVRP